MGFAADHDDPAVPFRGLGGEQVRCLGHQLGFETSDAVKLSSGLPEFVSRAGEGDVLVVVLAGGQAAVQAAEEPSE